MIETRTSPIELELRADGRTIVGTIVSREYVERDKGRLRPTDLGMAVNGLLIDTFPDIFNVRFTAGMEDELDRIEEGKQEWHEVVHDRLGGRDLAVTFSPLTWTVRVLDRAHEGGLLDLRISGLLSDSQSVLVGLTESPSATPASMRSPPPSSG